MPLRRAIVGSMGEGGCLRLVCQTGAMLGVSAGNRSLAMNGMARLFRWMQQDAARAAGKAHGCDGRREAAT